MNLESALNENAYEQNEWNESLPESAFESNFENSWEGEFGESHESLESHEHEALHENGEQFLGGLIKGLFGGGDGESSFENEASYEDEASFEDEAAYEDEAAFEGLGEFGGMGEYENGEQFFKKAFRFVKKAVKTAAPLLKNVAKVAMPMVAKAVGGAFGGPMGSMLAGNLANMATKALGEQEIMENESLESWESGAMESHEYESHEYETLELGELNELEAQAELMAHFAAESASEFESEALIGSSITLTLSPRDRAALRSIIPGLVRGAAVLTRVLRVRPATRPFIRVVPEIVRSTARQLVQSGGPVTRQRAARTMAAVTGRVLSRPRACASILRRNVSAALPLSRPLRRRAL